MSLDDVRLRVLEQRGRVMIRVGTCFTELTPDEARTLMSELDRHAAMVSYSSCDPVLRGERRTGQVVMADAVAERRMVERCFAHLRSAADAGLPCPSNQELCNRLGLPNVDGVLKLIAQLERRGRIRVERFSRSRVVTIMGTGRQTRALEGDTPHWRQTAARREA